MPSDPAFEPVSDEAIAAIVSRSRAENARYEELKERRFAEARTEARRLAGLLSRSEEIRRVILFGSAAASGKFFRPDSDIDLAIEGGDVLAARAMVENSSFNIDLVSLDSVHPAIRERILAEGETLYEA